LLFYGLVGFHIKIISTPCFTSLLASDTPRFTPFLTACTARFTSLLAAGAPRGSPVFTPFHTGHWLSA
jgi:hypothetical protein